MIDDNIDSRNKGQFFIKDSEDICNKFKDPYGNSLTFRGTISETHFSLIRESLSTTFDLNSIKNRVKQWVFPF